MPRVLNRLYNRFLRPVDPGLFITRYAAKSTVCCLGSLGAALGLGLGRQGLLWWIIGAMCTVMFRTGSTLGRRKMYSLILLGTVSVAAPLTAMVGGQAWLSLAAIFILSFACFFVSALGVSASILGTGCLVVSMISVFDPAPPLPALMRAVWLLGGGLVSFVINFYLWPFDPEKVLLSSAKLAVEDMGLFFDGLGTRIRNKKVSDGNLAYLRDEALASIRRYRTFMESFNVDPLKGSRARGGPGLFYYRLIRLYESLVGLSQHIHFCDTRPESDGLKAQFDDAASEITNAFDGFRDVRSGTYARPDFPGIFSRVEQIQETLVGLKGYRQGREGQDQFMEAWAAVHELKNVVQALMEMMILAEKRFTSKGDPHGA